MADKGGVWDQIAGKWKQFSGEVKKQWGDLTDDELPFGQKTPSRE